MRSLAGWIERHASFDPDKIALAAGTENLSYAALAARIARTTSWLEHACALEPGARIAWLGHNSVDLLVLLFACAQARLILVPLNWRLSAHELNQILADAAPGMVVVDQSCREFLPHLQGQRRVLARCAEPGFENLPLDVAEHGLVSRLVDADTPVLLVYTSGTTGAPKGALLSQRALLFNALNAVHMHDMTAADRVLTVLPMFHVGGLNIQTLPALYCGAQVILETRFDARRTLTAIADGRPSLTTLVPATISALVSRPEWSQTDLSSLRCITTGSTDVPRPMIDEVHQRGVPIIQIYGATETGPVAIYQRVAEAFASAGAIGRAGLHTDIRLVGRDGETVEHGQVGEIMVRGAHVATGYWDDKSSAAVPFDGGWFASGDAAVRDSSGLYWFKDRLKHVIISGGENIYPTELERILNASGRLHEAAVAGRADQRWGEVPIVIAVRGEEAIDAAGVLALFDDTIARYKRPREVVFVDALPRNALGKVEIPRLRELIA